MVRTLERDAPEPVQVFYEQARVDMRCSERCGRTA
jgi:hypothetical protein